MHWKCDMLFILQPFHSSVSSSAVSIIWVLMCALLYKFFINSLKVIDVAYRTELGMQYYLWTSYSLCAV